MPEPHNPDAAIWTPTGAEHHRVSRGWQQNFTLLPDKRITVLNARSGAVIEVGRPIRKNWATPGFSSFIDVDGNVDDRLELEWGKIEGKVLRTIRTIRDSQVDATQHAAVMNLLAIHLVRSEAFEMVHNRIARVAAEDVGRDLDRDAEAIERFTREFGRPPDPGELLSLARATTEREVNARRSLIESQVRNHNTIGEMLAKFHVQVVVVPESLPGLAIGDIPAVHGNTKTGKFGFRDHVAIGDSDLIMAPISRRVAVFLSATRRPHTTLTMKWQAQSINALTIRAALAEVACHPGDALELGRVVRDPHRFSAAKLLGTGR